MFSPVLVHILYWLLLDLLRLLPPMIWWDRTMCRMRRRWLKPTGFLKTCWQCHWAAGGRSHGRKCQTGTASGETAYFSRGEFSSGGMEITSYIYRFGWTHSRGFVWKLCEKNPKTMDFEAQPGAPNENTGATVHEATLEQIDSSFRAPKTTLKQYLYCLMCPISLLDFSAGLGTIFFTVTCVNLILRS